MENENNEMKKNITNVIRNERKKKKIMCQWNEMIIIIMKWKWKWI